MLQVKSLNVPRRPYRQNGGTTTQYPLSTMTVLKDATVTVKNYHDPAEFLKQGTVFNEFGDRSVWNAQFKGFVSPRITARSQPCKAASEFIPTPRHSTGLTVISGPPAIFDGTRWNAIMNYGPLQWTRYDQAPTQRRFFAESFWGNAMWSDRRAMCYYAESYVAFVGFTDEVDKITAMWYCPYNQGSYTLYRSPGAGQGMRMSREKAMAAAESACKIALSRGLPYIEIAYQAESAWGGRFPGEITVEPTPTPSDLRLALSPLPPLTRFRMSENDLSLAALETIESLNDYSSNLLAYASELGSVGDTIKSLLELVGDYKNPKAWASAWLSTRFGDRLQISDTKELLESAYRALTERRRHTKVQSQFRASKQTGVATVSYLRTSTLYAANASYDALTTAIESLMRWDAWPTLENMWDMIPLSFVVDWLLPVGDILNNIDLAVEAPYVKPISQFISERTECRLAPEQLGLVGDVKFVRYTREPHDLLQDVRPFSWDGSLPSFSVVHVGDALALLAQFKRI